MYNTLCHIFHNIIPARDIILKNLSASESSLILTIIGLNPRSSQFKKYLNPIRDLGAIGKQVKSSINNNYNVILLGIDVEKLLFRIQDPLAFYHKYGYKFILFLHIIIAKLSDRMCHDDQVYSDDETEFDTKFLDIKDIDGLIYKTNNEWSENSLLDTFDINILSFKHRDEITNPYTINIGSYMYSETVEQVSHISTKYELVSMPLISRPENERSFTSYINLVSNPFRFYKVIRKITYEEHYARMMKQYLQKHTRNYKEASIDNSKYDHVEVDSPGYTITRDAINKVLYVVIHIVDTVTHKVEGNICIVIE